MRLIFRSSLILAFVLTFSGCKDNLLTEYPMDPPDSWTEVSQIRIVSYNMHGGDGPNGEGTLQENLLAFKNMLANESVICLQEVHPDDWSTIKTLFSEYPYVFFLSQCTTRFGSHKTDGNAILSKLPIIGHDDRLIQTDPGGDKWQRKAQYVRIPIGNDHHYLNLFHFHNTYNWHKDDSRSEKTGLEKFNEYIQSMNVSDMEMTVVIGDFNLSSAQCGQILTAGTVSYHVSNWVDHIYTNAVMLQSGTYSTADALLSDHQSVWSVLCNVDC